MFKSKLFGNGIEPACLYCEHGAPTQDGAAILCRKTGVVTPEYHCRRFVYDPLKRQPKRAPPLTRHDPSEFEL